MGNANSYFLCQYKKKYTHVLNTLLHRKLLYISHISQKAIALNR